MAPVRAGLQGVVVRVAVSTGDVVTASTVVAVIESMKMEYDVVAGLVGRVTDVLVEPGANVSAEDPLIGLVETDEPHGPATDQPTRAGTGATATRGSASGSGSVADRDRRRTGGPVDPRPPAPPPDLRADLAAVVERHRLTLDEARPDAVAKRRARGQRTARENVEDLCDPGSFVEYGPLLVAAQRARRSVAELIERTPADGLIAGIGRVDGVPTAVLAYDATVLAGTQGHHNHNKKDRLFEIIERQRLPVVFFTEGGGGRPGDTDAPVVSGLDVMAFHLFARLSALVPLVGIASGRCFAGNAALLGCCDVVIATAGSNIGMGGPAMIEGGGLGTYAPEDIGPLDEQVATGVVDVAVADEAEAVAVARHYLSFFAGTAAAWEAGPVEDLRAVIPENRRQAYDVRTVLPALFDTDSVLELRAGFGAGMVTALARVEGHPLGVVANNPMHLAGAIDADGADKAARFLQLCDAHDLPVLFLCDTPGIMVGPDAERQGTVRHASRLFVVGANLSVPYGTIILRKAYGLGAQAMAGGSFRAPRFCVAWPTGELGGMGLEGAVRLGYRRELDAIADQAEREATFQKMVDAAYDNGRALNTAMIGEIDDVIDPADSRRWITTMLAGHPDGPRRGPKRRPHVDTW